MRIVTWNILHGGGTRRQPGLLMALADTKPDLVVMTEARCRFAGQMAGALADIGLPFALMPTSPDGSNGVLMVSRFPLVPAPVRELPPCLAHRWAEAGIPDLDLAIGGIHLPESSRKAAFLVSWQTLLAIARERRDARFIIAGDLNSWRAGRAGPGRVNLGRLAALGYADAFERAGDASSPSHTWHQRGTGAFRLDYVFASAPLSACLLGAFHAFPESPTRLSDHAQVVVDLAV